MPDDLLVHEFDEIKTEEDAESIENHQTFIERLKGFSEEESFLIDFAYDLAKIGHVRQTRDTGERYFEHLRNVALILIDEIEIHNYKMIIAALLHDSIEDTFIFGHATKKNYSEWQKIAMHRLTKLFDWETAGMIINLTKPKIDGVEILDNQQAHRVYINNLSKSSEETILIKMCDRLHNLRSLKGCTQEKQKRIAKETQETYFSLFEKVLNKYPKEGKYLLSEMKKTLAILANA